MPGHTEVNDLPSLQFHDDENVDRDEEERVLHKKIATPEGISVVLEKGAPGLRITRRFARFDTILLNGAFGVLDAEILFHDTGNASGAIFRMLDGNLTNEVTMLFRNLRTAILALWFRDLPPEAFETASFPGDHCCWLYDYQGFFPT